MSEESIISSIKQKIDANADKMRTELKMIAIDDESNNFDILEVLGKKLGIKVECFTSAKLAIEQLNKNHRNILCIFCDLQMPELDGVAVCDQLRKLNISAPFAILTGFISKALAIKALESKVSVFLEKPLNLNDFSAFFDKELVRRISELKDESDLLAGFIEESKNNLEAAEDLVVEIEQDNQNKEALNKLFGIVHTIKGSSGFFYPKTISQLAHLFEEKLKLVQKNELAFDSTFSSQTLQSLDWLKKLVNELALGENPGHDAQNIFNLIFNSSTETEAEAVITPELQQSAANSPEKVTKASTPKDIKVEGKVLDEFVRLSGEMTVMRNMINKSLRNVAKSHPGDRDVENLIELLDELHKINSSIQLKVSDLRRIPFKNVVRPMARAIRETAKVLEKNIELQVQGEDLRLDTSLVDVLNNSLIHLVRNSVDHGIEKPSTRKDLNKNPTGQIILKAYQRNDTVVIEIQDDGAGINTMAVKKRLIQNGQHTVEEVESMSEEDIHLQIFSAGFSTAEKLTDISGRGVGMSMVKSSVEEVGGKLNIISSPGKGSVFTLSLPIPKSVLITNCVFFVLGQTVYGIPQENVFRILSAQMKVETLHHIQTLRFGDDLFEVINLHSVFQAPELHDSSPGPYIIINAQGSYCAFQVQEVLEIEDTVIKLIPSGLNQKGLFKGTTFLSDGRVGLIMSADGLISHLGFKEKKLSSIQSTTKKPAFNNTMNLLCFQLSTLKGTYAINQDCLYRIEELNRSQIQLNGNKLVIPYRDSILHLFNLEHIFETNYTPNNDLQPMDDEKFQVFVIYHQHHYFAFEFKEITEVCEYIGEMAPDISGRFGVKGQAEINGLAVTLLDPIQFIETRIAPRSANSISKISA